MLPLVDYLTVHTPLNDDTRNLIGTEEVQMLKKGARLINCARGGIYDEAALVEGLKSGQIAGVALDVYPEEPCTKSPLFGMPGVLCTPHLGASTEEAQTNVAVEAAELLDRLLHHRRDQAVGQHVAAGPEDAGRAARLPERGLPARAAAGPDGPLPADQLPAELQGRSGQEGHAAALGGVCRRACWNTPWPPA